MKRIAITQRVAIEPHHGERRDCLDQRWHSLLESVGAVIIPVPNGLIDVAQWAAAVRVEGVILSGGNSLSHLPYAADSAPERDGIEHQLLDWAASKRIPVLGVCRGLQMMAYYLGATLVPVKEHAGTRHHVRTKSGLRMVNSYHNYALPNTGTDLEIKMTAWDDEGYVEAFAHEKLPWIGIMWHPERETEPDDDDILIFQTLFNLPGGA